MKCYDTKKNQAHITVNEPTKYLRKSIDFHTEISKENLSVI